MKERVSLTHNFVEFLNLEKMFLVKSVLCMCFYVLFTEYLFVKGPLFLGGRCDGSWGVLLYFSSRCLWVTLFVSSG